MYIGEDLLIKINASNPLTGRYTSTSTVVVNLYRPTKSPKTSDSDRAAPDHSVTLAYDASLRAYYGKVNTAGWPPVPGPYWSTSPGSWPGTPTPPSRWSTADRGPIRSLDTQIA